jgi:hypothetical protein
MGKVKAHYFEVISDYEEEEGFINLHNIEVDPIENIEEEDASHDLAADEKVTLA